MFYWLTVFSPVLFLLNLIYVLRHKLFWIFAALHAFTIGACYLLEGVLGSGGGNFSLSLDTSMMLYLVFLQPLLSVGLLLHKGARDPVESDD